ncbi:MAG: hypothetical protein MUF45_19190, partial [Spirosomaceae bacterium]|nr:hypothetical protein [Spirosomataceae bacterium]
VMMIAVAIAANAQRIYDGYDDYRADRFYYYDEQFDWHWDVRVRISNGIRNGTITNWEANRLYRDLERIERKEYAYASDGFFDGWEQDEIWDDIRFLNRRIGFEILDNDRSFYGFSPRGKAFRGYNFWFDRRGYDYYRFDKRGFGNERSGYYSRNNDWGRRYSDRNFDRRNNERSREFENRNNRTNNPRGYENERQSRNDRYGDSGTDYRNNNDRQSKDTRVEERRQEDRNSRVEEQPSRENRTEGRSNENRNGQINERNSRGNSQSTERNNNDNSRSRYEERYGNGRSNDTPKEREYRRQ